MPISPKEQVEFLAQTLVAYAVEKGIDPLPVEYTRGGALFWTYEDLFEYVNSLSEEQASSLLAIITPQAEDILDAVRNFLLKFNGEVFSDLPSISLLQVLRDFLSTTSEALVVRLAEFWDVMRLELNEEDLQLLTWALYEQFIEDNKHAKHLIGKNMEPKIHNLLPSEWRSLVNEENLWNNPNVTDDGNADGKHAIWREYALLAFEQLQRELYVYVFTSELYKLFSE